MRKTVIDAIAEFMEVPHAQVEQWDSGLVSYFIRNPHQFALFCRDCWSTRLVVWMQAVRAVAAA